MLAFSDVLHCLHTREVALLIPSLEQLFRARANRAIAAAHTLFVRLPGQTAPLILSRDLPFTGDEAYLCHLVGIHVGHLERPAPSGEIAASPDWECLRPLGITARESEVLFWVAQGKRNAEIACILNCSARTIGKHLENLLAKLAVESRGAAAAAARPLLALSR